MKVLTAVTGRFPALGEPPFSEDSKIPAALTLLRASSSSSSSSNNTAAADLLEEKQRQYDVLRTRFEELHEALRDETRVRREAEAEVSRLRQELGAQLAGHTRSANHLRDVLHPFFSSSSSSHQPGCDCRRCGGRPSSPSYTPTSPPTVAAHAMDCECDGCRTEVE